MTEAQIQHCINVAIDAWAEGPHAAGPLVTYALVRVLRNEVGNGSFAQYFSNSYGVDAIRAQAALVDIGLPAAAEVVRRAVSLFSRPEVLADRAMTDAELDAMEPGVFDGLSDELLAHGDDIESLLNAYTLRHREAFGI